MAGVEGLGGGASFFFFALPRHTTHNPPKCSRLWMIADALYLSMQVFKAWASTISVHDEDRASKRLRTRIAYTQNSEEALEAKRQHCRFLTGGGYFVFWAVLIYRIDIKVVQAFESALALLGDG